jgi:hypothetical protein
MLSRSQYRILIFTKRNLGCNNERKGEKPRTPSYPLSITLISVASMRSSPKFGPSVVLSRFHIKIGSVCICFSPTVFTMITCRYNTRSMLLIRSLSYSPPSSSKCWDPGPLFRCTARPQAVRLPSSLGSWTENYLQCRVWATDTQSGSMLIRPVTSSATWT